MRTPAPPAPLTRRAHQGGWAGAPSLTSAAGGVEEPQGHQGATQAEQQQQQPPVQEASALGSRPAGRLHRPYRALGLPHRQVSGRGESAQLRKPKAKGRGCVRQGGETPEEPPGSCPRLGAGDGPFRVLGSSPHCPVHPRPSVCVWLRLAQSPQARRVPRVRGRGWWWPRSASPSPRSPAGLVQGPLCSQLRVGSRDPAGPAPQACRGATAVEPALGPSGRVGAGVLELRAWVLGQEIPLGGGVGHWAPCPPFLPRSQEWAVGRPERRVSMQAGTMKVSPSSHLDGGHSCVPSPPPLTPPLQGWAVVEDAQAAADRGGRAAWGPAGTADPTGCLRSLLQAGAHTCAHAPLCWHPALPLRLPVGLRTAACWLVHQIPALRHQRPPDPCSGTHAVPGRAANSEA